MKHKVLAERLIKSAMFKKEISLNFGIEINRVNDLLLKIKSSQRYSLRQSGEMVWVKRRNKKRVRNGDLSLPLSQ